MRQVLPFTAEDPYTGHLTHWQTTTCFIGFPVLSCLVRSSRSLCDLTNLYKSQSFQPAVFALYQSLIHIAKLSSYHPTAGLMDSDLQQPKLTGRAELLSHRLSDSDSECPAAMWSSQLSPISSQPSLAELQRSCTALRAASLDSPAGSYQPDSPDTCTTGPGSANISSISPAEVNEMAEQADEGSQGTGSLKAESELLDPWDAPFESSLPISRCC